MKGALNECKTNKQKITHLKHLSFAIITVQNAIDKIIPKQIRESEYDILYRNIHMTNYLLQL